MLISIYTKQLLQIKSLQICRTELFKKLGFAKADIPHTDRFFDNMISIPWWSDMPDELIDDIARRLAGALDDMRG